MLSCTSEITTEIVQNELFKEKSVEVKVRLIKNYFFGITVAVAFGIERFACT